MTTFTIYVISLLMSMGFLNSPDDFNNMSQQEQSNLIEIIEEDVTPE